MNVEKFVEILGADFFAGVPDSLLKPLCNYLMNTYGVDYAHHVIAANEGCCCAVAAGVYLATKKIPVVYMQNSGEGNAINPLASLLNKKVYAIPIIFVVGYRGESGVHDEPQHVYQGEITLKLLEDMSVKSFVIGKETTDLEVKNAMSGFEKELADGRCVAFVIRKNALEYDKKASYQNKYAMKREDIIRHIVKYSQEDPVISTTGKTSRELFEIRESQKQSHKYDFLTVGSMGHASSIALGVALSKPNMKIWCLDGDGALLMHMGAMAVIASAAPKNLVHVVINNESHESVGGLPTAASKIDIAKIAEGCGYSYAAAVSSFEELDKELNLAKQRSGLTLIEAKAAIGARASLGRPTSTPIENKTSFMEYLSVGGGG